MEKSTTDRKQWISRYKRYTNNSFTEKRRQQNFSCSSKIVNNFTKFFFDSDIISLVLLKLSNIHCISKFLFQVVLQHRSFQFSQFTSKKYVWPVELPVTELGLLKKSAVLQWTNMLRNVVVSIIGSNVKFSVWLKRNSFVGKKNLKFQFFLHFDD